MIQNDDLGYPIVVSQSVRSPLRAFLRQPNIKRFVVLCDRNVEGIARDLTDGIAGRFKLCSFSLGERRKTFETARSILECLSKIGASRDTAIVGIGGGVASDLFGFAAAIYMRGVPYIHVATTLIAMVDAAFGGKAGVNLSRGKNLAGIFRDPLAVFAHIDALRSLPYAHIREGLAEMVKHAIIEGDELFESLETLAPHPFGKWPWESVVADSVRVKTMIVHDDQMEHGAREILNLGHTFAHGLESASSYHISHGAAVSVGLRAAGLLALRTGRFSKAEHLRVLTLLTLLKLPLSTAQSASKIFAAMLSDKKRRQGRLRFVLPRAIGDVEFGITVSQAAVRAVIERCTGSVIQGELTAAKT
ncbi:MAG: 3-dehydroquinate synthase [Candidatus Eremiobacteraeota bacterium]|nr:3-dehydroquinate synthase [Candidatus Eremiobacteraeota bacterium]